jgi:hypothetical protein
MDLSAGSDDEVGVASESLITGLAVEKYFGSTVCTCAMYV